MDKDAAIDRQLTVLGKSHFGKLGTPQPHQAYRPGLWHLMQSDPHDAFDGWRWSFTNWLTADSDPCDDWPYIMVGGQLALIASFNFSFGDKVNLNASYGKFGGRDIDFVVIDEMHFVKPLSYFSDQLREAGQAMNELGARLLDLKHMPEPEGYDYQRHNKVRKRRP